MVIGQILDKKDASNISGIDNNINSKNAHIKTSFNTYNIIDANAGTSINMVDTSNIGDIGRTSSINNNDDNKNTYAKASFDTYNIVDINADTSMEVNVI